MEDKRKNRADESLVAGYKGRIFIVISMGWLFFQVGRRALPPLLPTIAVDLSISPFQAGIALTLMAFVYALSHYPGGRLSDTLSRKTMIVVGLLFAILGLFVLTWTSTYHGFLFSVAIFGAGTGVYNVTIRSKTTELYERKRGHAFGMQLAAGQIGAVSAGGLALVALSMLTWHLAFLPVIIALSIVLLLVHIWNREDYVLSRVSFAIPDTLKILFGDRYILALVATYTLFALAMQGIIAFLPTLLHLEKGLSTSYSIGVYSTIFVIGIVIMPIAGKLSDAIARIPMLMGSLLVSLCGLWLVIAVHTPTLAIIGVFILGVGLMSFPPVMQAHLMDVFPEGNIGRYYGFVKMFYLCIGSFGSTYVGFMASKQNFTFAFIWLSMCFIAAIIILILISIVWDVK